MSIPPIFKGDVPANYEKYSGASVFEPYALHLIEQIQNDKIKNVLEIACGTGRVTNHLAKLIPDNGIFYATDISVDMVTVAKKIVANKKIKWQIEDAQALSFDNASFDHVVCQFGVMFFQDKSKAFAEVNRVLEMNGKFIFNTWDAIEYNPRAVLVKRVMRDVFNDVPEELIKGVHFFSDKKEIRQLLEKAGFKNIHIMAVQKLSNYNTVDDIINAVTTGSFSSAFLSEKSIEQQDIFRQVLKNEIIGSYGEKNITIPMQALVCQCTK
ncbi:MAG: methyltransferase domain-containing protein [Fimbriimonadaceae bacterium]|nr:methyltransferase domain-containing protein [Chitinophagales bacterium]